MMVDFPNKHKVVNPQKRRLKKPLKDGENKVSQHIADEELEASCTDIVNMHEHSEHSDQKTSEVEEMDKSVKLHINKQPDDMQILTSITPIEPTLLDVLKVIQQCQSSIGK